MKRTSLKRTFMIGFMYGAGYQLGKALISELEVAYDNYKIRKLEAEKKANSDFHKMMNEMINETSEILDKMTNEMTDDNTDTTD